MRSIRRTINPLLATLALSCLIPLACDNTPDEPEETTDPESRSPRPDASPVNGVGGPFEEGPDGRPEWPRSSAASLRAAIVQRDQMPPADFGEIGRAHV